MNELYTQTIQVVDKASRPYDKIQSKGTRTYNKLNKAQDKFQKQTNTTSSNFRNKYKGSFNDVGQQVPWLQGMLEKLKSPIAAATAAVVGLGIAFTTATVKASGFNNEFLEIRQLNLDKTNSELNKLRDNILNLSIEEGLAPKKTAKAFYDVQSATGKYGEEVEKIVEKVGTFAHSTKTDLPAAINQSVKAMNAFGFGAEKIDEFLASNYATIQQGITTYDELAKVQAEFGNAATLAGQNVNTANKVFAAFSKVTKNVDRAAERVKTAFEGISRESFAQGLEKIGVQVHDAEGNFRNLDRIIEDLVPKLQNMSDQELSKLVESIGGPEGVRTLFGLMNSKGQEMLDTFEQFDKTVQNADLGKLERLANQDLSILTDKLRNQVNGLMIKLGQKILPYVVFAFQKVTEWISSANEKFDKLYNQSALFRDIVDGISWFVKTQFVAGLKAAWGMLKLMKQVAGELLKDLGFDEENPFKDMIKWIDEVYARSKVIFGRISKIAVTAFAAMNKAAQGQFGTAAKLGGSLASQMSSVMGPITQEELNKAKIGPSNLEEGGSGSGSGGGGGKGGQKSEMEKMLEKMQGGSKGLSNVSGSGGSPKKINVTIDRVVGIENVNNQSSDAGNMIEEMEDQILEAVLRALRGAEQSI